MRRDSGYSPRRRRWPCAPLKMDPRDPRGRVRYWRGRVQYAELPASLAAPAPPPPPPPSPLRPVSPLAARRDFRPPAPPASVRRHGCHDRCEVRPRRRTPDSHRAGRRRRLDQQGPCSRGDAAEGRAVSGAAAAGEGSRTGPGGILGRVRDGRGLRNPAGPVTPRPVSRPSRIFRGRATRHHN